MYQTKVLFFLHTHFEKYLRKSLGIKSWFSPLIIWWCKDNSIVKSCFIIISTFPDFYFFRIYYNPSPMIRSGYLFTFIIICKFFKFSIKYFSTFNCFWLFRNTCWNLSITISRCKIIVWNWSINLLYFTLNTNRNTLRSTVPCKVSFIIMKKFLTFFETDNLCKK